MKVTFNRNIKTDPDKLDVDVVFRRYPDGDIVALFPYLVANNYFGYCLSYQRVGQHGAADYTHCIQITKPATSSEYGNLLKELSAIGYNVKPINRINYNKVVI